jgi:hypothetical protein
MNGQAQHQEQKPKTAIEARMAPELRRAVEDAAGPRGLSRWVRAACEERLSREGR